MTDANILSVAITLFAIAAGSIFNNVRMSDTATALNKRIDDVNGKIADTKEVLRAEMKLGFAAIDHKLGEILHIVGDHESRITASNGAADKTCAALQPAEAARLSTNQFHWQSTTAKAWRRGLIKAISVRSSENSNTLS